MATLLTRHSPALFAWLLCAMLDIVYAAVVSVTRGGSVTGMLRSVASGPFAGASEWGLGGALIGLIVHFAIMGAMVAFWFAAVRRLPVIARQPWWLSGSVYGVGLYLVMNAIVLPLRFGVAFPPADLLRGAIALFPHIFFVGWPLAWLTRKKAL